MSNRLVNVGLGALFFAAIALLGVLASIGYEDEGCTRSQLDCGLDIVGIVVTMLAGSISALLTATFVIAAVIVFVREGAAGWREGRRDPDH